MLRLTLAWLHLVALGLGAGAITNRARALRGSVNEQSLRAAFHADMLWGIAAAIWIATGLWRLLGSTEKTAVYYMQNHFFFMKMGFFLLILLLEIWPMLRLIRWRRARARGGAVDEVVSPVDAKRIAVISRVQAILVVLMVFAAVAMARGYGTMRSTD